MKLVTIVQLLLDNQSEISIVRKDLLHSISKLENPVRLRSVAGSMLELNQAGILPGFDVRCYDEQNGFTVHIKDADVTFGKKGKLYQADLSISHLAVSSVHALHRVLEPFVSRSYETVRELELRFTKEQVRKVKETHEL